MFATNSFVYLHAFFIQKKRMYVLGSWREKRNGSKVQKVQVKRGTIERELNLKKKEKCIFRKDTFKFYTRIF